MDRKAYFLRLDYKRDPVIIFVSHGLSKDKWGTFYLKPNGSLKRLQRSCLNMVDSFDQAQAMLDAYAKDKELSEAPPPTLSEDLDVSDDTSAEDCDPPPAPPDHPTVIIASAELTSAQQAELDRLDRRLEHAARDLIAKKNEKAAAVSAYNGEIKEIEEEIELVLSEMDGIRNKANRPQGTLPFDGKEDHHEPDRPDEGACNSCGHDRAAHLDADHAPRPCSVAGCGCLAAETEAKMQAEATA